MKKGIITAAIFSALLIGCKDTPDTHTSNEDTIETTEIASKESFKEWNNAWVDTIQLDESGNKWVANIETTQGVQKMLILVNENQTKSTEDYHSLAAGLNEVKNHVVKDCTMEGASHDNLHIFLYPLIEKINALGKVETVEEGAIIKESIKENLLAYYEFFK